MPLMELMLIQKGVNMNNPWEVIGLVLIGVILTGWLGPVGLLATIIGIGYRFKNKKED